MSCLELESRVFGRIGRPRVLPALSRWSPGRSGFGGVGSGAERLAGRLVGEVGPAQAGELAGDGDGGHRRALAALGEVAVSVMQPDLCVPGAVGRRRAGGRAARRVTVVPCGLDEQPAGVAVALLGDVPAVLLVAGAVLAGLIPSHDAIEDDAASPVEARTGLRAIVADYRASYPSAMAVIDRDLDELVEDLRFPSDHRKRIRSTNLLERTFVEVRRRTKVIGRFPGETSALCLIWAVLELAAAAGGESS